MAFLLFFLSLITFLVNVFRDVNTGDPAPD